MEKVVKCGMRKFEYDRNENENELITLKCGREKLRTCLVIVFKNRFMFFRIKNNFLILKIHKLLIKYSFYFILF